MGKDEKLLTRFLTIPSDFTFRELVSVMRIFGYTLYAGSEGSRTKFYNKETGKTFQCHKPHPEKEINKSTCRDAKKFLQNNGHI